MKKRKKIKRQPNKVDLHGLRHHMVRSVLIEKIEELWSVDGPEKDLEIITGHSERMKEIVKEVLNEYDLESRQDPFFNRGCIKTTV